MAQKSSMVPVGSPGRGKEGPNKKGTDKSEDRC